MIQSPLDMLARVQTSWLRCQLKKGNVVAFASELEAYPTDLCLVLREK